MYKLKLSITRAPAPTPINGKVGPVALIPHTTGRTTSSMIKYQLKVLNRDYLGTTSGTCIYNNFNGAYSSFHDIDMLLWCSISVS